MNSLIGAVRQSAGSPWVKGVVGTTGTRAIVLILGLGSTIALARGLGPEGRGVYALAMTFATIGLVAVNLGFHTSNTYFSSREPAMYPALLSNTLALALIVCLLEVPLLVLVWGLGLDTSPLSLLLVSCIFAWLPIGIVFLQLQPMLLTLGLVRRFNLAEAGWQLLSVTFVLCLWATGSLTPVTAFAAVLGAFAVGAIYVGFCLRRIVGQIPAPSIGLFRRTVPYATRSWVAGVTSIALVRLDTFLVVGILGTRAVGLYAVAVTVCEAIMILPGTISSLLLPKLSRISDESERWDVMLRVLAVTAVAMTGLCGLAAIVASPAIGYMFGSEYLGATTALYWLLPGVVLLGINAVLVSYFYAIGIPAAVVAIQALAVACNLGLALVLLKPLGLAGAGLSSAVAYGGLCAATAGYALFARRGGCSSPIVVGT